MWLQDEMDLGIPVRNADDPELAEIERDYPAWHLWRWNNQVYARRVQSSPPIVMSRPTAAEIRAELEKRSSGAQ